MIQVLIVSMLVLASIGFLVWKFFFRKKACNSCAINTKTIPE